MVSGGTGMKTDRNRMTDRIRLAHLLTGAAMISVAGVGYLTADAPAHEGTLLNLRLAGGGSPSASTRAVLRQTGADAIPHDTMLDLMPAPDSGLRLALPGVDGATLTEIALVAQGEVRWQTVAFLDLPAKTGEASATRAIIAEPAALVALIGTRLNCPAPDGPLPMTVSRAPEGTDLTLTLDGQSFPLVADGDGWAAGALRLDPRADATARLFLQDGTELDCRSAIPAGLRPLQTKGPGWALSLGAESIGWVEAGKPPVLFPASGTLAESTLDGTTETTDRITFRSPDPAAPQITAVHAACTDATTGLFHSWRLEITGADGTMQSQCAAEPRRAEDGTWQLDALNGVHRRTGASMMIDGQVFTATSVCHFYEGHLLRQPDAPIRLIVDRHEVTGDCPKKGRAMAEALDAALASGAVIKEPKGGGIGLVATGDDLDAPIYIMASRDRGS